ncbi:MAG: serine--tRNA ligase [Nitrospinae bacterium]|nr:serine--tRNA ligase [Nitrospinota bacterium]
MLDTRFIAENSEKVKENLVKRNDKQDIDELLSLIEKRRVLQSEKETKRAEQNKFSKEIGKFKQDKELFQQKLSEMKRLSEEQKEKEEFFREVDEKVRSIILGIPNILDDSVPTGQDENDNPVVRVEGNPPELSFSPLPHEVIGEKNDILDLKTAAKITGSRFALFKGFGARLERALINFLLDLQTKENGYTEISPPFIVNDVSLTGTGQLPKFKEDLFQLEGTDYYLIPTAEVPVTNIHRDEILKEDDLTIKYCAYTPCFRSEAGSYGKDTRGIIRQHQFDKVELVKFCKPENSFHELELLLENAELPLKKLGLAYRVILLCSGDIGFSSAKTYDIEVWMPSQNCYREISSCSNFIDFQARRANIRYRKEDKNIEFVHTLNGSGLAVGRLFAAILENFQNEDGTFNIPEALKNYL